MSKTARIFAEVDGKYHICDDGADILDARGKGYNTKVEAMRAAVEMGYTHAAGSGTYWDGIRKLSSYCFSGCLAM